MLRFRDLVHAAIEEAAAQASHTVQEVATLLGGEEQRRKAGARRAGGHEESERDTKREHRECEGESVRPRVPSWATAEEQCRAFAGGHAGPSPEAQARAIVEELSAAETNVERLRQLCRGGVPPQLRGAAWRTLLGYLPARRRERSGTLAAKRRQYWRLTAAFFPSQATVSFGDDSGRRARVHPSDGDAAPLTEQQVELLHQVVVDVKRTVPTGLEELFSQDCVRASLTRVLYVYSVLHQRSGYWQGLNEVPCPFYAAFLSSALACSEEALATASEADVAAALASGALEADVYWCVCRLVQGLQQHGDYAVAKYGDVAHVPMLAQLRRLVALVDQPLLDDLDAKGINPVMFAFRWMICLLMRELPMRVVARLWDCYLAEGTGVTPFHLYVCTAFLELFGPELKAQDSFEETLMFLQRLPTTHWPAEYAERILARAYEVQRMHAYYAAAASRVLAFVLAQLVSLLLLRTARQLLAARARRLVPSVPPSPCVD